MFLLGKVSLLPSFLGTSSHRGRVWTEHLSNPTVFLWHCLVFARPVFNPYSIGSPLRLWVASDVAYETHNLLMENHSSYFSTNIAIRSGLST